MRGNVVDLAVAVVIGGAFGAVVTSLVENLITPIIGAIGGTPDFKDLDFAINGSTFGIGLLINAIIAFVIVAFVIFIFVVKPMNLLIERSKKEPPADPTERKCPSCLSDVPIAAIRCRYCTSDLPAATAAEMGGV
jgi:large conductance mechanosensitive channel